MSMSEEIWADIEDAPNYEVSTEWRVRNKKTGRILKYTHFYSRPRVVLMVDGERLSVAVEDLVADAFGREAIDDEIWRTISIAWNYEISDQGRVRNKKTKRILRTFPNNVTGRPQVTMMDAGERMTRQVHKLLEDTFGE